MYTPPAFRIEDLPAIHAAIRSARIATLVTATADGPTGTPLPMLLAADEGEHGVLYGHLARANPQWTSPAIGPALAIFMGPDAYVSPSAYATKRETGKVVPTWNYLTVHATGPVAFFEDTDRLLDVVTRLTRHHESARAEPWEVADAPAPFIASQLKGIVGVRLEIARLEGKLKMSQNRPAADRAGVAEMLAASDDPIARDAGRLVPR